MFVIIGAVIVLVSIIGGYLMEHGQLATLYQPAELVIIGGAAMGSFIIASPKKVMKNVFGSLKKVFTAKAKGKDFYLQVLSLLFDIFAKMRKEGLLAMEKDLESPDKSPVFQKYPDIIKNHHLLAFICDNLNVIVSISVQPHEIESLMDIDIEVNHESELVAASSLTTVSDSLPGLGIVAAVLGVVVTMGKISEPPEVLGHSIGAALVGTFLGILLCYGFLGPISTNIGHLVREEGVAFHMVKVSLIAYMQTTSPQMAVEFGRRAIAGDDRPTFAELQASIKKGGAAKK
jgi:chemotaxis protein MotA